MIKSEITLKEVVYNSVCYFGWDTVSINIKVYFIRIEILNIFEFN